MIRRLSWVLLLCGSMLGIQAVLAESTAEATIRAAIEKGVPRVRIAEISPSPITGIYRVTTEQGPVLYSTADGSHFIVGDLYRLTGAGAINVSEEGRAQERVKLLSEIKPEEMVIFPGQPSDHAITIFSDVDCGACRELHKMVPALNKAGIEVRYLAFPREGLSSATHDKMVSVWCAKERQQAFTDAKAGRKVPTARCSNPVAKEYALGLKLGVQGTPAIILADGQLIPGMVPFENLVAAVKGEPGAVE